MNDPKNLKIAYIGGGSRGWAHKLMSDLAVTPELGGKIALYDLDFDAAKLNEKFGNWIGEQPETVSKWEYAATATPEEALAGADFIVMSIQPGSLALMQREIELAEKYGMYFPVGDTIGIPGLSRGLRSAAIFAGYARLIAEHCPDAWAINYSNPLTIFTRALTFTEPGLKAFGCCHEVFGTQWMFARLAEEWYGAEIEGREEIEVNVLGINHFTWLDRATWNGHDLLARLRQWIEEEGIIRDYDEDEVRAFDNYFHSPDQVKFRMFMRYGLLPCAGDRHLVEFIPGFVQSEETLFKYGVVRTPISYRMEQKALKSNNTERILSGDDPFIIHQSDEEAVRQIKALLGLGDFMTNVNVENVGQIPNLPHHAVVETNAYFSQDSVRPLAAGSLPPGVWGLVAPHVNNQEMIVQAAITGDRDLALQAFINDPLNTASVDETVAMFEEALDINRPFLDWVD